MDRAKAKWRVKLQRAFAQRASSSSPSTTTSSPSRFRFLKYINPIRLFTRSKPKSEEERELALATRQGLTGKYILLILPLITVLREGMEAIIFVGGVALGQPAVSIPIAAIVGLVCGIVVGVIIYAFASRSSECLYVLFYSSKYDLFIIIVIYSSVNDVPRTNDQPPPPHRRWSILSCRRRISRKCF